MNNIYLLPDQQCSCLFTKRYYLWILSPPLTQSFTSSTLMSGSTLHQSALFQAGKRTFLPWTAERLKGERYGTHSLGQVCPERMFLTFLHSTPTLQAVDQPCFANALTGSRNARLSYGFRRKPTKSDFHFIRMSVLILTPLQCISYARNP